MNRIAAASEIRTRNKEDGGIASLLRGMHEGTRKEAERFVESYIKIERRWKSGYEMKSDNELLRSEGILAVITKTLAGFDEQNGRHIAKNMLDIARETKNAPEILPRFAASLQNFDINVARGVSNLFVREARRWHAAATLGIDVLEDHTLALKVNETAKHFEPHYASLLGFHIYKTGLYLRDGLEPAHSVANLADGAAKLGGSYGKLVAGWIVPHISNTVESAYFQDINPEKIRTFIGWFIEREPKALVNIAELPKHPELRPEDFPYEGNYHPMQVRFE